MATDEEDFSTLSIDDRIEHKNWKARQSGYTDLAKKLRTLEEDDPAYIKYSYNIHKYVIDSNAAAQEKGLDVVTAFLENAPMTLSGKSVSEIMQGITAKCFNTKPKTKEIAISVCLQCVEVEKQDIVVEVLIGGFSAKIPKIVIGCIAALAQVVVGYGVSVLPVKTILKSLQTPFSNTDKNIRTEVRSLSIELCKYVKADVLLVHLRDLKPVLLKELEAEWVKVVAENPRPTLFLRSKKNTELEPIGDEAAGESAGEATPVQAQPALDPWEMIDPVDLTKHLPPDFYQNIVSTKWSERKDAIVDFLEEASKIQKVKPADYSELLTAMHKIITKDTNIVCVQNAAKVVTVLAKGLRKSFEPHCKLFTIAILEKMKEKKPAVISVLSECADAIYQSTTLLNLHEDILEALENKNPNVKAETCLFTARCLCYCSPTTLTKPIVKAIVPSLKKRLDDTTPLVRDAASTALGTCLKILGERALAAYFEDIDKNKMAKIQEATEKAELKVPQGSKTASKDKKTEKKAVSKVPAKVAKKESPEPDEEKEEPKKKVVAKTAPKKAAVKSSNGATKAKTVKGATKAKGASKGDDYLPNFDHEPSFGSEDLDVIATNKFGEDVLTRLADPKWNDRVLVCNEVKEALETSEAEDINSQLYLHIVMVKPGLADGNLQVLNIKLSIIGFLAKRAPDWGSKCSEAVIATLGEKLGELKLKASSTESLFCIAERIQSLHHVACIVMAVSSAHKSAKVQSEGLIWLATALEEFGLKVKLPAFIGYIKTGLGSTNPTMKNASMKLLGAFAVFFGTQKSAFKDLLGELNPNIVAKVDKEITAATENPPPKPTRGLKPSDGEEELNSTNEDNKAMINLGEMIPRVDISDNFKGTLMANLSDKKEWQLRNEALQEIQSILKQNPSITPNLGELPAGLKARLSDTNKNLVVVTLSILATLPAKLGSGLIKIVRSLLPAILTVLSDAKPNVREAGMSTLNSWYEYLKLTSFFDYEMILTALKTDNPNLKADLLGWISDKIKDVPAKTLPRQELLAIIPTIGSALEDRAAPVRDKSKTLLLTMVECLGKDPVLKASAKAPGQTIKQILSKLPAAPIQATAAPVAVKVAEPENTKLVSEPPAVVKTEKIVSSVKPKAPVEPEEVKPFKMGPSREQREREEKKSSSRCPRWDFETPTADHTNYLRVQFEKCMDVALLEKLLDVDVQKVEAAVKIITGPTCLNGPFEAEIINCVDLIFKFIAMKLTEKNNTKFLKLSLDLLRQILEVLSEKDVTMSDSEANSIIPYIVLRLGNPNETLRKEIRSIIQLFTHVYTTSKIFMFVSVGLISRNSKQKVDCIEVLGELIREQGTGVCTPTPQKAIETIAKSISDADHKTKNAALNCMIYVYKHIGETLFKFVGNISPRDKDLLQEKIKKSGLLASSSPPQPSKLASRQSSENIRDVVVKSTENIREHSPTEQAPPQAPQMPADQVVEPEITAQCTQTELEPKDFPLTIPTLPEPQKSVPKITGPFSVDIDAIYKKHELKPTTPLSKLKRPSGYEELLKKPTNTTNYQTNMLYARQQYAEDLPAIINNLASQDLAKVDHNYRMLEQVIKLQPFEVAEYVDSLVSAALIQISTCVSMLNVRSASEQMLRVIRGIISCLINALEIKVLSNKVKQDNLRGLFQHLAEFLTNPGLNTFDEGVQVIRALNLLVAKILESVDKNELFAILLTLMLQSITNEGASTVTTEIYMKCLWRLTRTLEEYIKFIKINTLLHDVDRFFIDYSRINRASPKSDDKVFKTAKTIVYHVANALDTEVWDYTDKLARPEQSRVTRIIRNTLNKMNKSQDSVVSSSDLSVRNSTTMNESNFNLSEGTHTNIFPAARFRAQLNQGMANVGDEKFSNQEVNSQLAQIFTQIGARENSGQGLANLYDFMIANPTTDLWPFLKSTSSILQGYIERGLLSIEREKKNPFKETAVKSNFEDIETRSSYIRLREKTRVIMDLDLPPPPTISIPTPQTKMYTVDTQRGEHNGRAFNQPQGIQTRLSPKEQQQKPAPRNLADLRKRLEMASNASAPSVSATSAMTSLATQPDKLSELRERLRLQQHNT